MAHQSRITGLAGLLAAASLVVTPAQAHAAETAPQGTMGYATGVIAQSQTLPQATGAQGGALGPLALPGADQGSEYFGFRRRGRGYRGRRGVRGGDILAGVLVLGGIAAIASAASKNNRRRDREVVVVERDRDRDRDYNYRPENRRSTDRSTSGGSGIDNAVSMCLNEIEQNIRVDSVDGASRVSSGWVVTGSLFDGSGFSCEIDNSGQISGVDYGRGARTSYAPASQQSARAEGQLSDNRYSNARADLGGETRPDLAIDPKDQRLPAYPGGPLPGEAASE
ncbi:MAG: hypothetical protein ABJK59_11475 [Erythrobacter sp.]|uniref:hypothetical protein n=1 Tax=Erythrobacter sp. TaxID=1042 RepID=UPI003298A451